METSGIHRQMTKFMQVCRCLKDTYMVYTIGDKMDESMKVQNTFYYVLKPFCSFISIVKFVMPFHQFPSSVG